MIKFMWLGQKLETEKGVGRVISLGKNDAVISYKKKGRKTVVSYSRIDGFYALKDNKKDPKALYF